MLLFDAAHHHAEVARFNDYAHAQRLNRLLNRLGDLHRQTLLHLKPARKDFYQPRHLAQTDYLAFWNIRNVHFAEERQDMVLAKAEHLNVLYDHHLVVIHAEESTPQDLFGIFPVAFGEVLQRLRVTLWSLRQSLAIRLFSQPHEHLARQFFKAGAG